MNVGSYHVAANARLVAKVFCCDLRTGVNILHIDHCIPDMWPREVASPAGSGKSRVRPNERVAGCEKSRVLPNERVAGCD